MLDLPVQFLEVDFTIAAEPMLEPGKSIDELVMGRDS